jgi:hypothetical protein
MAGETCNDTQQKALAEFEAIRKVLRVPFPEDMRDLVTSTNPNPEIPVERRWKGPCLGFKVIIIGLGTTAQTEKTKPAKKA